MCVDILNVFTIKLLIIRWGINMCVSESVSTTMYILLVDIVKKNEEKKK